MKDRRLEAIDTLVSCDTTYNTLTDTLVYDDCSSTANWNVYGGSTTLSIIGGQLNVNSSAPGFGWGTSQYFTTQAGVTYTVSFDLNIGSCTGSALRSEIIDNAFTTSVFGTYTTSGSYSYTFTATGSGFGGVTFVMNFPGAACDFSIDNLLITFDTTVIDTIVCDTSLSNRNYRYGFNGKERDNEVKGETNSYDFGSRLFDNRLGKFLTVDPLFTKSPTLSNYQAHDNNPISFIDEKGEYRMSKRLQRKYPELTNMLKNIQQTTENHPEVYNAFRDNLGLTDDQAKEILTWGKGPKIKVRMMGAYAKTGDDEKIVLNKHMVKQLEGKRKNKWTESSEGMVALVFTTLLHEGQHHAEFKYKITKFDPYNSLDPTHEGGFAFELAAFGAVGTTKFDDFSGTPIAGRTKPLEDIANALGVTKERLVLASKDYDKRKDPDNYPHMEPYVQALSSQLGVDTKKQRMKGKKGG